MKAVSREVWRPDDDDYDYIPDPLGRIGQGVWRRRPRPDWQWAAIPKTGGADGQQDKLLRGFSKLDGPVGRDGENWPPDVARIETLLGRTGHLDLRQTDGPTGYYGARLDNAIRRFQKDEGLTVDGRLNPDGPTITKLAARAEPGEEEAPKDPANPASGDTASSGAGAVPPKGSDTKPAKSAGEEQIAMGPGVPPAAIPQPVDRPEGGVKRAAAVPFAGALPLLPVIAAVIEAKKLQDKMQRTQSSTGGDDDQARFDALADTFIAGITRPVESSRGDEATKEGNDIVAKACRKVLEEEYPDFADKIEHAGGATKDGGGEYLPEKYLNDPNAEKPGVDPRQGSSHPDLTWFYKGKDENDPVAFAHANTATTGKRGMPTAAERRSFDRLVDKVGADLATQIPKYRPGMDKDEYQEMARQKCREIFGKWLGKPRAHPEELRELMMDGS